MIDLAVLGRGPAACGAAAAGLRRGWRVRMVELAVDDVPRAWWRIGPTPMFPAPVDGLTFEDRSVEQLGGMGDFELAHEWVGASPVPESRHVVHAPMGSQPFDDGFLRLVGHGVSACAWSDGSFFRGRRVAVAGSGLRALDAVAFLEHQGVTDVILLCPTPELVRPPWAHAAYAGLEFELRTNVAVRELLGRDRVEGVRLAGGEEVALDGLFIARTPVVPAPLVEHPEHLANRPLARAGIAAGVAYDDPGALWLDGERCVAALGDP